MCHLSQSLLLGWSTVGRCILEHCPESAVFLHVSHVPSRGMSFSGPVQNYRQYFDRAFSGLTEQPEVKPVTSGYHAMFVLQCFVNEVTKSLNYIITCSYIFTCSRELGVDIQ